MDIIIDANIIRRDLKLTDKNFEIVVDYLKRTNSQLIFPSIVVEEVKGLYKRALTERYDEFKKSKEKLESTFLFAELPKLPEIDIEADSEKYIEYMHSKLGTNEKSIIHYKNEFLPELVKRAIERKKPLDDNGQQFRDGLLWLTVIDYAKSIEEKRVTLISDNPKDFAEKGENKLSIELEEETKKLGIEIKYFKRLSDFVKEHASEIEFINKEWIGKNIDINLIDKLFGEFLSDAQEEGVLKYTNLDSNEEATGHANCTDYINSSILDFYIYEKSDGVILLNIEVEFETEYEIEIVRTIEHDTSKYDYRYITNPRTGEPDLDMVYIPDYSFEQEYDYKYNYPIFRGQFVLTIKDKKVTDYELKDWDWG